jgi:hypothetical protein
LLASGDIMGCGILFPRDYCSELDSDGSQDASPDGSESPDDLLELEFDSESEDEEWWERPYAENGTKVQVSCMSSNADYVRQLS